ncbi:hypothetical protein XENOCAPTIV_019128 [Xenoophorus captivus]|uniref:Uncharacterized protein n=1 Tax=Xenoophorus captivus TaxID=1517983 RepID=A0ABV0R145_9TELE
MGSHGSTPSPQKNAFLASVASLAALFDPIRLKLESGSACAPAPLRYMPISRGPHEVVAKTSGLNTFLCNFWMDFKLMAIHSPLCRPNPKCIYHHQPSPGRDGSRRDVTLG